MLNTHAIDATKKRILNILNNKISKKIAYPSNGNGTIATIMQNTTLNKCNSSQFIGPSLSNGTTTNAGTSGLYNMFSLKT